MSKHSLANISATPWLKRPNTAQHKRGGTHRKNKNKNKDCGEPCPRRLEETGRKHKRQQKQKNDKKEDRGKKTEKRGRMINNESREHWNLLSIPCIWLAVFLLLVLSHGNLTGPGLGWAKRLLEISGWKDRTQKWSRKRGLRTLQACLVEPRKPCGVNKVVHPKQWVSKRTPGLDSKAALRVWWFRASEPKR